MTYDIGNPGPCLGEAQEGGRVKSVNGIYVRNNNHRFIENNFYMQVLTVNTI